MKQTHQDKADPVLAHNVAHEPLGGGFDLHGLVARGFIGSGGIVVVSFHLDS